MTIPPIELSELDSAIRRGARIAIESDPPSARDAVRHLATYRDNLAHYRLAASRCVANGDHRQAAEKSWGAFAQAIKAVSAARGVLVRSHADVLGVALKLAGVMRQADRAAGSALLNGCMTARTLHQHFYENDLSPDEIPSLVRKVMRAVDLLDLAVATNGRSGVDGPQAGRSDRGGAH